MWFLILKSPLPFSCFPRGRAKIGISTETRETSVFYAILPICIQYAEFFRFCWFLTVCRAKHWTLPILLELADLMKFTGSSFLPGKPSKMDKIEKFLCIMSRQIDWHQRLKFPLFLRIDPQKVSLTPTPNFTQIWPEFWALDLVMVCSRRQSRKTKQTKQS